MAKSLYEKHGRKAIPILQGMMKKAATKKLPKRFVIKPGSEGNCVIIFDKQTGKTTSEIGFCDLHGAIQILKEFF